jgi:hypothetical protein
MQTSSPQRHTGEARSQAYEDDVLRSQVPSRRIFEIAAALIVCNALAVAVLPADYWGPIVGISLIIAVPGSLFLGFCAQQYWHVCRIRRMLRAPLPTTTMYMRRQNRHTTAPTGLGGEVHGDIPYAILSPTPDAPPVLRVKLIRDHLDRYLALRADNGEQAEAGEQVETLGVIAPRQWVLIRTASGMLWPAGRARGPSAWWRM